jgi:hypothetical protein
MMIEKLTVDFTDEQKRYLEGFTGGVRREKARALAQGEDPDGDAATLDVMAVLQKFSGVRPHPEALSKRWSRCSPGSIRSRRHTTRRRENCR